MMMKQSALAALAAHLVGLAAAGTKVWDGSFDDLTTADLADWSWSNQVGPYQWYIHGDADTSKYLDFSADAAGPGAAKGAKVTLDDTAYWNGQNMRRTELIPSVTDTSSITSGTLYYHFSLRRAEANAPSVNREHQIAFFESHFTELKYGWISGAAGESDDQLRWYANSESQWNTTLEAGVWHNFAYEIDFDASTVGFWHSTGSDALTQAVAPVKASVSSNGADWHVGVLELARDGYEDTTEDLFFSGVYIESGDLTTGFSSAGSSSDSGSGSVSSAAAAAPSSAAPSSAAPSSAAAAASAPASSAEAVVAPSSSSSSSSAAVAPTSQAAAAPTAAAPATTALASSSTKSCVKRTKTVYVTQSA
ncbi:putative carbohydrate-binding module family 1 protein [Diaporthe ampelina]|uniref:Putative carbohydrate-binding module family 1 protein n=1 Tax=Diaporthe ampelina TaxID=1214573 RepID=A0A0G2FET0_9PEZI|nr:putative carbohydrate-binding module family 1 protein [Diaporthe ampelina]